MKQKNKTSEMKVRKKLYDNGFGKGYSSAIEDVENELKLLCFPYDFLEVDKKKLSWEEIQQKLKELKDGN